MAGHELHTFGRPDLSASQQLCSGRASARTLWETTSYREEDCPNTPAGVRPPARSVAAFHQARLRESTHDVCAGVRHQKTGLASLNIETEDDQRVVRQQQENIRWLQGRAPEANPQDFHARRHAPSTSMLADLPARFLGHCTRRPGLFLLPEC
ncbi:uncharacterized protein LOC144101461 [Amblyomma americanum]